MVGSCFCVVRATSAPARPSGSLESPGDGMEPVMRCTRLVGFFLTTSLLAGSASAGGGSSVSLHRVEVDVAAQQVTVEYSKDFATCAHMKDASNQLVHTSNVFCTAGNDVVTVLPLSAFTGSFAIGASVKLCHGNNANICSPFVTVTAGTCQADLGFGGPGDVTISVCGADLSGGQTATYELNSSLASSPGLLFVSLTSNPTFVPVLGGTIVPLPILVNVAFVTDAAGDVIAPGIPGGSGPLSVYAQAVVADAAQPKGYAVSNAIRIDFLP